MSPSPAVAALRTPEAVRERSREILEAGLAGELRHFRVRPERLGDVAGYVAGVVRERYPALDVPFHSRWRHFDAGGPDRFRALAGRAAREGADAAERARLAIDLAVVSVLLDAGAGEAWRYREPETGLELARSEGLAVASLRLFEAGAFSSDPGCPLRVDAPALAAMDEATLAAGFQSGPDNPLAGAAGRLALLGALGRALAARPDLFGADPPRPGGLYDHLAARAAGATVAARDVLGAVLEGLAGIWPGRIVLDGENLGDVWRHPAVVRDGPTNALVPFHKLSQWLAYSLVEPLESAGVRVAGIEELTGLAEYRNGGLLLDLGALELRDPAAAGAVHDPGSELVVEWRALTVALLDRLAPLVRSALGLDDARFPLARMLEGGTWAAGRRVAAERRSGGAPPLRVASDGTVF